MIINASVMKIGKVVLGMLGTFQMLGYTILPHGAVNEQGSCEFEVGMDVSFAIFIVLADACICGSLTFVFIRILNNLVNSTKDREIMIMLKKTRLWTSLSIVTTLVSCVVLILCKQLKFLNGFDCSVNSLSLLVMMYPVTSMTISKIELIALERNTYISSSYEPSEEGGVEVEIEHKQKPNMSIR